MPVATSKFSDVTIAKQHSTLPGAAPDDSSAVSSSPRKIHRYPNYNVRKAAIESFLNRKKMPKESLARALNISVKNLEALLLPNAQQSLIAKTFFPLADLYFKTDWGQYPQQSNP